MAFEARMEKNRQILEKARQLYQKGMIAEEKAVEMLAEAGSETLQEVTRDYLMNHKEEAVSLMVAPAWLEGFYDERNRPMCITNPMEAYITVPGFKGQKPEAGEDTILVNSQDCRARLHVQREESLKAMKNRFPFAKAVYFAIGTIERYTGEADQQMYIVLEPNDTYSLLLNSGSYNMSVIRQNFSAYFAFADRTFREIVQFYTDLLKGNGMA